MQQTVQPSDQADAARVIAWASEMPRRPANVAFTAGAERQAAYWIEWAEEKERERCAQVAETCSVGPCPNVPTQRAKIADAIRAQAHGQTP